jgi:hypothetical protein
MLKKGELGPYGDLIIYRSGEPKHQRCPKSGMEVYLCGDGCPFFGEPIHTHPNGWELEICEGKVLKFKEFDERRSEL